MKRKIYTLIIVLIMAFNITGCSKEGVDVSSNEKSEEEDETVVGVSFDSFVIERWQRDRDVFVSTCNDLGAETLIQNANGDVNEQLSQIDYFIDKGVDAIVIVAVDCGALKEAVAKAHRAGIPVIAYDRIIRNADEDLYISFDNEKVGQYMAETFIDRMPEGGAIIKINGPVKDYNVTLVNKGFDETISRSNSIRVISNTNAEEWMGEEAYRYLASNNAMLQNVQGIMCGNDSLAGQAIKYLTEHRLIENKVVVGQDAELDACQRVVEGTQAMTVYKPIDLLAKKAAECAVLLGEGKKIEDAGEIKVDDMVIPYIAIEPVKVTADNMDEVIIDSGFHLKEDVYLLK